MKKAIILTVLTILLQLIAPCFAQQVKMPYKDASLPVEQRLDDLLARMTFEEKLGQLCCTMAWNYYERQGDSVRLTDSFLNDIGNGHVGMLWATFRADPWTRKSLVNGLTPTLAARMANEMQRYAVEHTLLGIPLFLAEEAPHGHMAIGATTFPTGLGLAATFSTQIMESVGRVIGKEVRLQGAHVSYGPVMDLARDARWSRVEESLGEDPTLSGQMAAAQIRGLGGGDLRQPYSTVATPKHFVGYGTTEGGHNARPTTVGPRQLREQFLPPFKQAVEAGALSVMTSYNSIDGMPVNADGQLLNDILRKEWNFRGFVVSDLYAINGLKNDHHVAATLDDAASQALRAGVDVDLGALCFTRLTKADSLAINQAARRVLRLKMEMGLFENPYVDEQAATGTGCQEHSDIALQAARASVTLLKNDGTLPFSTQQRIAVIGPNADNIYNMLGDYTAPQSDGHTTTLLQAIRQKAPATIYAKGCAIRDSSTADIQQAVAAAYKADVVVAVVGGSSARDFRTNYDNNGAAHADNAQQTIADMDCGEGYDRATLHLLGRQQELLQALHETGKPLVVVYIEGRPLDKNWAAQHANALLTAYYPGQEGGRAIADVLFGNYNPAGRLPVSVPRNVGQIPVYYNQPFPLPRDYTDMDATPLFAFGFGLSYTTFHYANLTVSENAEGGILAEFDITNTGQRDGEEVPQLYLHHEMASTVQPAKQLKAFCRVMIRAGETRHIAFTLQRDDLAIVDRNMQRVVEPGAITVMVGPSSDNIALSQCERVPERK